MSIYNCTNTTKVVDGPVKWSLIKLGTIGGNIPYDSAKVLIPLLRGEERGYFFVYKFYVGSRTWSDTVSVEGMNAFREGLTFPPDSICAFEGYAYDGVGVTHRISKRRFTVKNGVPEQIFVVRPIIALHRLTTTTPQYVDSVNLYMGEEGADSLLSVVDGLSIGDGIDIINRVPADTVGIDTRLKFVMYGNALGESNVRLWQGVTRKIFKSGESSAPTTWDITFVGSEKLKELAVDFKLSLEVVGDHTSLANIEIIDLVMTIISDPVTPIGIGETGVIARGSFSGRGVLEHLSMESTVDMFSLFSDLYLYIDGVEIKHVVLNVEDAQLFYFQNMNHFVSGGPIPFEIRATRKDLGSGALRCYYGISHTNSGSRRPILFTGGAQSELSGLF
jgi:hypothetical protein